MTEKETWLKIAAQFDAAGPCDAIGICHGIDTLAAAAEASYALCNAMKVRLRLFSPHQGGWYWPCDKRRVNRTLRATACCFLAAMCDD